MKNSEGSPSRSDLEFTRVEARVIPFPSNRGRSARSGISPLAAMPAHRVDDQLGEMGQRWNEIQSRFVDDPRGAIVDADKLIGAAIERATDGFMKERARLKRQWNTDPDVSTEDLRISLQQYRRCFDRLLSLEPQ